MWRRTAAEEAMSYCIVLYWFEAAPPAAADKGFARFRSYVPNLMVAVLCEARWSQLSGLPLSRSYAMSKKGGLTRHFQYGYSL